jgi:hypothetical protein
MRIKSIRIFIKYLRKFLAGFVSVTPFANRNSNTYHLSKKERTIDNDFIVVGQDLNLAINKHNNKNK